MKLVKKIFVVIMIVSLAACKSDDDGIDTTIDTDGDGIADVDDLCPDEPGTLIDQGCYLLTNVNIDGVHALKYLLGNIESVVEIKGVPVDVTTMIVGDTFQVNATFNVDGTYSIVGQYRTTTTITIGGITNEDTEIIDLDETGIYSVTDSPQTITISNASDFIDGIYEVAVFDQNEIIMIKEETTITNDGSSESIIELRFNR